MDILYSNLAKGNFYACEDERRAMQDPNNLIGNRKRSAKWVSAPTLDGTQRRKW